MLTIHELPAQPVLTTMTDFHHARPCRPCACLCLSQLIESALPKLPRDAGVTAHWLCINGVQPDLPENISVAAPPSKRRQLLGPAAPGTRAGALQEAAAAAAAAGGGATYLCLPILLAYTSSEQYHTHHHWRCCHTHGVSGRLAC